MNDMFLGCESIKNIDFSNFNTSNVNNSLIFKTVELDYLTFIFSCIFLTIIKAEILI